jgi:hypothetical protein
MKIPHWSVESGFGIFAREIPSCGRRRQENTHQTVVRYDCPVHDNQVGKIVDNKTLAFGHPVTIIHSYNRPGRL